MKIIPLALMLAVACPAAAFAGNANYSIAVGNLQIFYVRGAGIKTFADERDQYEKRRDRLGSGLLILGDVPYVPVVPLPRRKQ